jgi:hypothetical protein
MAKAPIIIGWFLPQAQPGRFSFSVFSFSVALAARRW